MTEIDATIEMFAEAEEGSRELSDAFLLATGWRRVAPEKPHDTGWVTPDGDMVITSHPHLFGAPDPSRNFDDAVEAVPSGYCWEVEGATTDTSCGAAGLERMVGGSGCPYFNAAAKTPELALCICILLAHKAITEEEIGDFPKRGVRKSRPGKKG